MKIFLNPINSKNYLITLLIGDKYKNNFYEFILNSWELYCKKNDIGLILFENELIEKNNKFWKKPNWQKLLIPIKLRGKIPDDSNLCFLDTDILINPFSPNIFDFHDEEKVSVVSQVKNLPYNLKSTQKNISFFRHNYYSNEYPLDSAIFMKPKEIFLYHGYDVDNDDYTCTGLFMFNLKKFGDFFEKIFYKYPKGIDSITGGGEEFHLNLELFYLNKFNWLQYKFQAIWNFEISNYYSYLYFENKKEDFIIRAIQSSLLNNYFLHFAGSWHESDMYKFKSILNDDFLDMALNLSEYKKQKINYKPQGLIKPNK